ncbi:hypothetical protein O9992_10790 [Vibrio lentus]|nr:hypothetical protein [Vibrio lentus]
MSDLSPKRTADPPLDYDRAYQIKKDFSDLVIAVNGGITTLGFKLKSTCNILMV